MMQRLILQEANKTQLLSQARRGANYKDTSKGKNRFERRTKSKISNSVKEYNKIDMKKFFKDDILDLTLAVHGETDDYYVSISIDGVLKIIREELKRSGQELNYATVLRSIIKAYNLANNVYVRCTCPDWAYRLSYFASLNNIILGDKETRPSKITNPNDALGPACKHVLLVLSNSSWCTKLASTIWNYINYVKKHYEDAYAQNIYPKLYGKEYEDDTQLGLFDDDAMNSDEETIDKSNEEGRTRGQFKPGNKLGIKFTKKNSSDQVPGQETLDLENENEKDEI